MNPILLVVLSALSDFVIAGGGVLLGGNLQMTKGDTIASGVWTVAVITGAVAFAKEIKQRISGAVEEHKAGQA